MWQAWIIGISGLWLAVAPFVSMDVPSAKLNNIVVGLIVAIVGWYVPKEKGWERWLAIVLGVWVLIAAFIPDLVEGSGFVWNNLISGVLIAVGGFASLARSPAVKHA